MCVRKSKVVSCGNVMPCENAMSLGNFTSCLVEIQQFVSWKFYFYGKLWHITRKISRVATSVHMCRNEIIVEWYHYVYTNKIVHQIK